MYFKIKSLFLWSKNPNFTYHEIPFSLNKINIITGSSKTGKSAIIPIIDYCLGSSKCAIPVDTIRDSCSWFGILIQTNDEQLLICREEAGSKKANDNMYFERNKSIEIPKKIEKNSVLSSIKQLLNELFGMTFLSLDNEESNYNRFLSRPSYRDFMSFIFQPQNIIANADVLFYKADTMDNRRKLINLFPYILGAATPKILAIRQELMNLNKELDSTKKTLENIKNVTFEWRQEILSWISKAREYGLTNYTPNKNTTFEELVNELTKISKKSNYESNLDAKNIESIANEITALRTEEKQISNDLFISQNRYQSMMRLKDSSNNYNESLKIQLERLNISSWLKNLSSNNEICPICGNNHKTSNAILNNFTNAIKNIENEINDSLTFPNAFERELQRVKREISVNVDKLKAIQKRINFENNSLKNSKKLKFTSEEIARFIGQLEMVLATFNRIGKDGELENKILQLNNRIAELTPLINKSDFEKKISDSLNYIQNEAMNIISTLDVEYPSRSIEFIINDLTIKVKNSNGRDDYLWEIGSASNWLSYHISILLAFQKFFQNKNTINIPNILILDQPSQVYFPQTLF